MSAEQYVNDAESTLDGSIDDTQTSIDVDDATSFPASGDFRIKIGDELLLVTAVSSNTFTVDRGIEGTTPASHNNGDAVTHIVTAESIKRIVAHNVGNADAIGSRPAVGTVGRLFIPDSGLIVQRDNGVSWESFGPIYKFTQPPALSNFTGVNTTGGSTAVAADQGGIISVTKPPQNGINISAWVKSAPSTPYTITAAMTGLLSRSSFTPAFGLCFRQASDPNKFHCATVGWNGIPGLGAQNYTALTTLGGDLRTLQSQMAVDVWWLRIEDEGATGGSLRKYWYSLDGQTWCLIFSHGRTTTITPDQVGFYVDNQTGTNAYDAQIKLLSWEEN